MSPSFYRRPHDVHAESADNRAGDAVEPVEDDHREHLEPDEL
jgi:hypothetical protein